MTDITQAGFAGAGRMAQALATGLATRRGNHEKPPLFFDPADAAASSFQQCDPAAQRVASLQELATKCDVLILAVKPQVLPGVLDALAPAVSARHLIISVAAGFSLARLAAGLGNRTMRLVRVMPNTPCLIGQGISALSWSAETPEEDRDVARRIFAAAGETVDVAESHLDAVTGLSGSGPAWVYTFVEALVDAGVLAGLPRNVAGQLALQTVRGSAAMIASTGKSPADLRNEVTSPGGTTIAGLQVLEQSGFRGAVMDAVVTAARRARELGS